MILWGGGGEGGEFFWGNIRSGWRKCFFEGKKGFFGKIATTILFGGGGKNEGGWPPRYPPKISPKFFLTNLTQQNLGKFQKKFWEKSQKKIFWKNLKKKILEKFQKFFLGKCPRKFWEKLAQKSCWSELGKFFFETFKI